MISYKQIGGGKGAPTSSGAVSYYEAAFVEQGRASNVDNYYANELAFASWQGKTAKLLGMAASGVTRDDFKALLEGKLSNKETGEFFDLSKGAGKNRRLGYDFTVSAPKSVSVVALVGHDQRVIDAHVRANLRTMEWLEKHGAYVRVKDENGQNKLQATGNLIYATVGHETSRSNEPQLHNHNVVIAATFDSEKNKWRSLTNDVLLEIRSQADIVYKSELVRDLKRLGYQIEYDQDGSFEIAGIKKEQLEAFSTRSKEIDALLTSWGINPNTASYEERQKATLASRDQKIELPRDELYKQWHEMAARSGLDLSSIVRKAQSREQAASNNPDKGMDSNLGQSKDEQRDALHWVSWAVEHLSEREQAYRPANIETTALTFSKGDISIDRAEWALARLLKEGVLAETKQTSGEVYVTTAQAIKSELNLLSSIQNGKNSGCVVMKNELEFKEAIASFEERKTVEIGVAYKLSNEQVQSARNILMHEDKYQGIQGDAGTGKTAALEMVYAAAAEKGWTVLGVATSSNAAKELQESSGIPSQTVAGYIFDRENSIKILQAEIAQLRDEISRSSDTKSRFETVQLNASSVSHAYRDKRYTFDLENGDVFSSPDSFRQRIGERILRGSENSIEASRRNLEFPGTGNEVVRARASQVFDDIRGKVGRALTSYDRVETAEAISARAALYSQRNDQGEIIQRDIEKKLAELANLEKTGNREGKQTLLVMDEASLTGVKDTASITMLADMIGARVVFQGDTKQHGSVAAGKAFVQAQKAGMNTSVLKETRRFDNATPQTRQAVMLKSQGKYGPALDSLDRIDVPKDMELAEVVAKRYLEHLKDLQLKNIQAPRVGVVALTNKDRKQINLEIHNELARNGLISDADYNKYHLEDPKLTGAEKNLVNILYKNGVNHFIFHKPYKDIGVKSGDVLRVASLDVATNRVELDLGDGKTRWINPHQYERFSPAKLESRKYSMGDLIEARANIKNAILVDSGEMHKVSNGTKGEIVSIDRDGMSVKWSDGSITKLDNMQSQFVDHGYTHTSFKEQGATNHREIIAVSDTGAKIFNREAADVVLTRAKDNAEIVTTSYKRLRRNADKSVVKTTAIEIENETFVKGRGRELKSIKNINFSGIDNAIDNMKLPQETRQSSLSHHAPSEHNKEQKVVKENGRTLGM
ncbi:relaxase domain-containing protein [Chromobacterium haemolyticum]|uniref:Relaxase domain-containing protein n=1 Tax=Chromobacterium fluminis TaxID=3044269 RepID=A0ABX0L7U1_9NEIS|nr:MobF family relaxase [Chromobacterium haemolyticum]NHR07780.1 relaxase domain-containing protein [Chromobacterium haemolyticum]